MKDIVNNEEIKSDKNKRKKFVVKWRKVRIKMKEISVEEKKKKKVNNLAEFLQSRSIRRSELFLSKNLASLCQRKFLSSLIRPALVYSVSHYIWDIARLLQSLSNPLRFARIIKQCSIENSTKRLINKYKDSNFWLNNVADRHLCYDKALHKHFQNAHVSHRRTNICHFIWFRTGSNSLTVV